MDLSVAREIFSINNLLMMNLGIFAGTLIGAMPGLNVTFAIAILLPMTFGMDSIAGMYLMLGSYCGALYGGSITAILINTPGTGAAMTTTFDGYPMAQKGRAGDALKAALVSSAFGGLFSCVALLLFAPQIAKIAEIIASPEYFVLCIFGMCAVAGLSEGKMWKGLIMALLGLLLTTVGMDAVDGVRRFTFGSYRLMMGFKPVSVMLGLFAISEVLVKCKDRLSKEEEANAIPFQKSTLRIRDFLKYWKTLIKSSVIGVIVGAIPGTGAAISSMISYNEAKRSSKHPEEFGQGCIEGVVASESGNNAVSGATLIPLLTLGIPGDSSVAVLLGALTMQGIVPGAALFTKGSSWVYAIMVGLFVINVFMYFQGEIFIRIYANVSKVPIMILLPCIVLVTSLGGFAISNTTFDLFVVLAFGLVGFVARELDFPLPPMAIGMVLGTLAEANLRRSLVYSGGNFSVFFTRPVCVLVLALSVMMLFYGNIRNALGKRHGKTKK